MDEKVVTMLVGIASGTVGYWFTTFWMKPILRYQELRSNILISLVFYAQVVNAEGLNDRMQKLHEERIESNRRHSAELTACLIELPGWYRFWLLRKGYMLERAAKDLIGFSNTTEYEAANRRVERIKTALCFNTEII